VAFGGGPNGGGSSGHSILYGSGGPVTVVVDTSVQTQWSVVARPSINNSQAVAFMAVPAGGGSYDTVIRADGAAFTTIAEPGMSAPGAGVIHQAFEPALNNAGRVEFFVNTVNGMPGIFTGAGGALTRIVTNAGNSFSGINDSGRVAFASGNIVQSGAGGKLTTIAAPGALFHSFSGVAAINNSNAVAFSAQTHTSASAIFVGDGVLMQPVVETGDVLPGLGTVTWAAIAEEAINDHGAVAFVVQYDDAGALKFAIVRADPILPEITKLKFAAVVAGCKTASATVTLDRVAPPGGVLVEIDNTNPAATAPASLRIATNKVTGKFVISTTPVGSNQAGTITAAVGASAQAKPLTVRRIGVQSVTVSPNPVTGGNTAIGTVTLECAAAPGDISVALSSNNPSLAQPAAASLLFPAGTQAMTFEINTTAVIATANATIKAAANGITKSRKLTITP
jgi:hypothetical protein